MRGWRLSVVGIVIAISVVAASSAASAPQELRYSRLSAAAEFLYELDYGSNPDSEFNGTHWHLLAYRVNAIVVYDGRSLRPLGGQMLAEGSATVAKNMTEWRGVPPTPRRRIRCPGSTEPLGGVRSATDGARFSGGGNISISNDGLVINPGRAVNWSLGCAATEGLETHGLPGGPTMRLPAPGRSRFAQASAFGLNCFDNYEHGWDPAQNVPGAHKFKGHVILGARFTPFPASRLTATKKSLRDRVGKHISWPGPKVTKYKECP